MLPIVFPSQINWFYELQAHSIAKELVLAGTPARAIAADAVDEAPENPGSAVLIVNLAECILSAERSGQRRQLLSTLHSFERRILLNYDSIYSNWFKRQFEDQPRLITEIFDVCMKPQAKYFVRGLPYSWIAEAFTDSELRSLLDRRPDRPVPWAIIGHATPDRAAFASAAQETLGSSGFAFLPPLRPYQKATGLGDRELMRILERCDFYLWNSHHEFPYHEGFRALHAIRAGALPAKIDPLNWRHFTDVPWVYRSLTDLKERRDRIGLQRLYKEARDFVLHHGTVGRNLAGALRNVATEIDSVGDRLLKLQGR